MPAHASQYGYCQYPSPCGGPLPSHTSAEGPQTLTDRSDSVSSGTTAPFPWVWCAQGFVCALQESLFPPVLWKFCNQTPLSFKVRFPGDSQSPCEIPRLGSLMGGLESSQQCENFLSLLFSSLWVTHLVGLNYHHTDSFTLYLLCCSFHTYTEKLPNVIVFYFKSHKYFSKLKI